MMVDSGARGNSQQIRQIAGMKGLVSNPRGEMIPRPIKSSFREGLSVLEYFISTHGARKGLADTALRTADSGYLTRRLVDVAQELIVREEDCGSTRGIWIEGVVPDGAGHRSLPRDPGQRPDHSPRPSPSPTAPTLDGGHRCSTDELVSRLRDDPAVDRIRVRSVLTCEAEQGICAACYGQSLATGAMIELGEAVGVIAAQSIGEPGTQLTMRTFHTGGIVGEDITHGLPRVVELFEARTPKGAAVLARHSGVVRVDEDESGRRITVVADDGEEHTVLVAQRAHLEVADGQEVAAGDALVEGPKDPKELLEVKGIRETQQYLVEEVQKVYRDQGVSIHDKHIELIVRQMLRRVLVAEPGDAPFLPGERVDSRVYAEVNRQLVQDGQAPGRGPARADGDHQGLAGHRQLAVGRLLPGDDPGAHRGGHRGQVRPAVRAEGEHHHRQADPGRVGHGALPRHQARHAGRGGTARSGRSGATATPAPRTSPPGCGTPVATRPSGASGATSTRAGSARSRVRSSWRSRRPWAAPRRPPRPTIRSKREPDPRLAVLARQVGACTGGRHARIGALLPVQWRVS